MKLLAIVCWHLYNVHFSPAVFPMSKIWLKGTITYEEMQHEHPAELERIEAGEAAASEKTTVDDVPSMGQDTA